MIMATTADLQDIATARLAKGRAAWTALQSTGGLWPPCNSDQPLPGMWEGGIVTGSLLSFRDHKQFPSS